MTKNYNLSNKVGYKSKINMKSFLINNKKGKPMNQNNISSQATEVDRASQRSIVETTNAYIRAAQ